MDELKLKINEIVEELIIQEFIKNLCGFDYFFTKIRQLYISK